MLVGKNGKRVIWILSWTFLLSRRIFWHQMLPFTISGTTQERKISPKKKFLGRVSRGHPGVICADVWGQNFRQALETLEKQAYECRHPWPERADVHDPRGCNKNLGQKILELTLKICSVTTPRKLPGNSSKIHTRQFHTTLGRLSTYI